MTILTRVRPAVIRALKADEVLNNERGWTINLAIFRIVILSFGMLPWALLFLDWTEKILPGISRDMWVPISFYRLLPIGFLGNVGFARGLAIADIVLIALGIVGFWTRSSIALATLISLYGFGVMQNLGKVNHHSYHLIWFMALLAAGPAGHFLSIDALGRTIKNADEGSIEMSLPSPAALWTPRYTWLLLGALYLVTGIAKLHSTLTEHWAGSANLRNILWTKWLQLYWYDPHVVRPIRVDLLPSWILVLLGASVVAFEVGFILLVFFRRLRPALALWGLAFHVGNGLVLDIWFTALIWAYVCLFDWTAIGRAIAHRGRDPLLVFYHAQCGLCRRMVR